MIKRICSRLGAGLMASAITLSTVIMPAEAALAWTTNPAEHPEINTKSYVCKMVGKPGTNERFQTGNNPIQVDRKADDVIGKAFSDAHDGSFIVGFGYPNEPQNQEPTLDDCTSRLAPAPSVVTGPCIIGQTANGTASVSITNNDAVVGNIAVYTVTINGSTQTTGPLTDGQSQTLTFTGLPIGTHTVTVEGFGETLFTGNVTVTACEQPPLLTEITIPQVDIVDECGLDNAVYGEVPAGNYSVVRNSNGSITLTANAGYLFEGGVDTITLPAPEDNGILCTVDIPTAPNPADPCGLDNAYWIIPESTEKFFWWQNEFGHLVVDVFGVTFHDGTTSYDYGLPTDSGELCHADLPDTPTVNDPCGIDNAEWIVPSDTNMYTWAVNEEGHLIVTTTTDYEFPGGKKSHDFGVAKDSGVLCPIVPAPVFTDQTCSAFGTYTIPDNDFIYTVQIGTGDEKVVTAGTRIVNTPATITIRAYEAGEMRSLVLESAVNPDFTNFKRVGMWNHDYKTPVNCTPGQGGNPTTPVSQPETKVSAPAVTELPTTGARENISLLVIGAAVAALTYGAVYFANSRRQFE